MDGNAGARNGNAIFGVEARNGVFFCTVVGDRGAVLGMRIFPSSLRGVRHFERFAQRFRGSAPSLLGLFDGGDGEQANAAELGAALEGLGFRVLLYDERTSPLLAGSRNRMPDGARRALSVARIVRQREGRADGAPGGLRAQPG